MSASVLSEDIINLVSQLADLQSRKQDLYERVQLYEDKLSMTREASLSLASEEQELADKLQELGFYYGNAPVQVQEPVPVQVQTPIEPEQPNNQDQLAALLSTLFQQQQAPVVSTSTPVVPTNVQHPVAPTSGGIYQFPTPQAAHTPIGSVIAPTSGPLPLRAMPKTSPTSAPGLSIRRGGK